MIVVWSLRGRLLLVVAVVMVCSLAVGLDVARAESLAPWWGVSAGARPTALKRGRSAQIVVSAENLGDADATGAGAPVRIEDALPPGLKAITAEGLAGAEHGTENGPVACLVASQAQVVCTFAGTLRPYEPIEVRIGVTVSKGASSGEENTVSVSGGGAAATKEISRPIQVGGEAQFGVEENLFVPEEAGGGMDTQAGSHPFQLTSVLTFDQGDFKAVNGGEVSSIGLPRDISDLAPAGLFGNPTPFEECTDQQFVLLEGEQNNCPIGSVIGVAVVTFDEPAALHLYKSVTPVFNLVPEVGEPARFGFYASIAPVMLDVSVRTGGDYGVTVSSHNTSEIPSVLSSRVTLWGVPGDRRHDAQRGWECLLHDSSCPLGKTATPPFLSMPTSCTGPLQVSAQVDSWADPSEVLSTGLTETLPGMDGCNHLSFDPSISVAPDVQDASTPTGLAVGVHLPQSATLDPTGLAESAVRDITVALPEGVAVNPAGADGLEACSEGLVGFTGFTELEPATQFATFTPKLPEPFRPGVNFCPNGSKIGTVKIRLPILPNPLEGAVYLATQDENPFGSLVAMYIVAEDPVSGVLIKLPGEVSLTESGQIISTFKNSPQGPLEEAEFHFFGGERAPLTTPAHCGVYTTGAQLVPWSGNRTASASSSFQITAGPAGSSCPGSSLPFEPSLTAGTTSVQAGGFSPFTMTMSRPDGSQNLRAVQLRMPPGLSGVLAGVPLCGEAQANAGTCGAGSLIGETTVSVGLGGDPYTVSGGKIYLTGPYEGAPFGLSIVDPAKAGPFDLERQQPCDCLVVRAKIEVDPRTADLTITSDSSGPHSIPSILQGIPLQIKHVNVTVTRAGFTFNPTSCKPLAVTGSLSSAEGATQALAVPFRVTNCAALKFAPKLVVSASAKTSRAKGASLTFKLTYPEVPIGTEANIAKAKVELPKRLPSRLTTLQKACAATQFDANPAGCPAASVVGHAKAITPILPVPLEGPVYFVSHGGEAFPSLIVVLQGYGVTVDLVSTTFISKQGITSGTFKTVPDVPVRSFVLTLPEGKYSALAANGNLCDGKLGVPTEFLAQSGAAIHLTTTIKVTGCPKVGIHVKDRARKRRSGKKAVRRRVGH
jgi:hypothetical protein